MPAALAVPASHNANNIEEFVQLRRKEGDFTYGMQGSGSVAHLTGLRFAVAAKMNANPVGYQGGSPWPTTSWAASSTPASTLRAIS